MRRDEEFGKEALHRYLCSASIGDIEWQLGNEPPDFELTCDRGRFSVEVTRVVPMVQVRGRCRPERFWSNSISAVVGEMEKEGRKKGLQGLYRLDVEPIANLSKIKAEIQRRVFAYARAGGPLLVAYQEEVWYDGVDSRWAIRKVGPGQFTLGISYSSGNDWKGPDDIQQELDQLVADALDKKRRKTSRLNNVVLVLVDDYHFGQPSQWLQSVERSHSSHFSMIVRAYQNYCCQILLVQDCGLVNSRKS